MIKAHADPAGALADNQVILAYRAGRPSLPYAAVHISGHAAKIGHDEMIPRDNGGTAEYRIEGERTTEADIHAYGYAGAEWLENLVSSLADTATHATWTDSGITVLYKGPVRRQNRMKNSESEPHFILPVRVGFRTVGPWKTANIATNFNTDLEVSSEGPVSATLLLDIDVDVS